MRWRTDNRPAVESRAPATSAIAGRGRALRRAGVRAGLCLAAAAAVLAPLGAADGVAGRASLTAIGSRVDDSAGIVTIEASAPVPFVTSQPDPRTLVVELRDVDASSYENAFAADARHPVTAVDVESAVAPDGAAVARVRLSLSEAGRPRVRSSRNTIVVEAPRTHAVSRAGIGLAGPATAIRDIEFSSGDGPMSVTLVGTGPLPAATLEAASGGAAQVYLDLPNVTWTLPSITPVDRDPVSVVRSSLVPDSPLTTRVAFDLSRGAEYHLERSAGGDAMTIVFDEPPPSPLTIFTDGAAGAAPAQAQGPQAPLQAQAAQAPVAAQQQAAAAAPPQFTGEPISLDFQDADLRAVLRVFADVSGLNIVIDPAVQGTVDVALRDVPWDQALDIILRANRLGYSVEGTIVRIAPLTTLADEERERAALAQQQALAGELQVRTIALSYARAEDLEPLLTSTVLSARGSIQTDVRTNTLIINDLADQLTSAEDLIARLDVPQPQVEIEARIVQTTREFAQALGVQWGADGRASSALGNTLPTAFPNQVAVGGRVGTAQGANAPDQGFDAANSVVDLAVNGATSAVGVALGSINGAVNLDVALSALEREGQGRVLSTPRVTTQNNIEAEITQGVQIPIQTIANNTVTVTFQDAALTLLVTPQITASNTVIMRIQVENASPDFSRSVNNIPPIDTQRAITQVLVNDGETTVIGGIYISQEQVLEERTPVLSRIPLLGWLFRRNDITDQSRELLIFITPRITRL